MHNRAKIAWWYLQNMPLDELAPVLIDGDETRMRAELQDLRLQRSYPCAVLLPPRQNIKRLVERAVHTVLSVRRADLARNNYAQEWPTPPDFDRARINVTLASAARTLRGYGVECDITVEYGHNFLAHAVLIVTARFRTGYQFRMAISCASFVTRRNAYEWLEHHVVENTISAVRQSPRSFVTLNPPAVSPQLLHFSAV